MVYKRFINKFRNNMNSEKESGKILKSEEVLEGKSLQVYWHLLENGSKGIREIQKDLNFTTPATVSYQIKKLSDAGIVSKDETSEKYFVKEEVKTGLLGFYIKFGFKLIPRYMLYLIINLAGLTIFALLLLTSGIEFLFQPISILFLINQVFFSFVFISESIKIWNMKP